MTTVAAVWSAADLELALRAADAADDTTMRWWDPAGVDSTAKDDGSPVTEADPAAERAVLEMVRAARPDDGFLGEELGELEARNRRRWIVDGIDGTWNFAAGSERWGTLIALEVDGEIVVGVCSSPAQRCRWWASRGQGAYRTVNGAEPTRIRVADPCALTHDRMTTLPRFDDVDITSRLALTDLAGATVPTQPWSQQMRVAEGEIDLCVWFVGDTWDHAAPSIIVEEAGGRFSDHAGGRRLDTRTAIYSNGVDHDRTLRALRRAYDAAHAGGMGPYRLRRDDREGLAAVIELVRREFAYMDGVVDPPSSIHRLTIADLAEGSVEVWAIGESPIACVVLTPKDDALYVGKLAVHAAARGAGLSRRLLELAEQRAEALGLAALELQTRIELEGNQAIFRSFGFEEIARTAHPGYSRPTSITFRKPVARRSE